MHLYFLFILILFQANFHFILGEFPGRPPSVNTMTSGNSSLSSSAPDSDRKCFFSDRNLLMFV